MRKNVIITFLLAFALFFGALATVKADNMIYSGGVNLSGKDAPVTTLYGGKFVNIKNPATSVKPSYGSISGFITGVTVEGASADTTLKNALLGFNGTTKRSFVIKNALYYKGKYYDTKTTITSATAKESFAFFHRTDKFLTGQLDVRKYADSKNKKVPLNNPNNAAMGLIGNNISNCPAKTTDASKCSKVIHSEINITIDIYKAGTNEKAVIPNLVVGLKDIDWGGGFYLPEGLTKDNAIILDKAGNRATDVDQLYYNSSRKVVYSELGATNGTDEYDVANVYWKSENARKKGTFNITYGYRQAQGVYLDFGVLEGLPEKTYATDTPSGKNNSAVKPGDTIKYSVKYTNGHSSQSAEVKITDTISKGLTYVPNSAKIGSQNVEPTVTKNSDGTTTLVWTRSKVAPNTTENLTYSVIVGEGVSIVQNNAIVRIGDSEFKLDPLKNPIPTKEYATDTPSGKDGAAVKKDDEIKYNIKYTNAKLEKTAVKITDVISDGLEYVKGSAKISGKDVEPTVTKNIDGGYTLVWETSLEAGAAGELVYSAKVTGETSVVQNNASIQFGNDPSVNLNELKNPVPSKEYASDTPSGKDGAEVTKGNEIKYSIKYANVKKQRETIKITDVISNGLEYIKGSAKIGTQSVEPKITKNSDGGYTLVWETSLEDEKTGELTYSVKVTGQTKLVKNNASIQFGNNPVIALNELKNPLKEVYVPKKIFVPNAASPIQVAVVAAGVAILISGVGSLLKRFELFPFAKK